MILEKNKSKYELNQDFFEKNTKKHFIKIIKRKDTKESIEENDKKKEEKKVEFKKFNRIKEYHPKKIVVPDIQKKLQTLSNTNSKSKGFLNEITQEKVISLNLSPIHNKIYKNTPKNVSMSTPIGLKIDTKNNEDKEEINYLKLINQEKEIIDKIYSRKFFQAKKKGEENLRKMKIKREKKELSDKNLLENALKKFEIKKERIDNANIRRENLKYNKMIKNGKNIKIRRNSVII